MKHTVKTSESLCYYHDDNSKGREHHLNTEKESDNALEEKEEQEQEEDIPPAFICPISLQIMRHPVLDPSSSHTFERASIMEWLWRGRHTNPLTRGPLRFCDLVQDTKLELEILQWKMQHGLLESAADKEEAKEEAIPWYRRKPSHVEEDDESLTFYPPSLSNPTMLGATSSTSVPGSSSLSSTLATSGTLTSGDAFMHRLIEAQRRDAEFRKRINYITYRQCGYRNYSDSIFSYPYHGMYGEL